MSKRVIRILSYEGNPEWIDKFALGLRQVKGTKFFQPGTIKELHLVELQDNETLQDVLKKLLTLPENEPSPLCGKCRFPLWSVQHYWQCGWRDENYNIQGQKK